ncbi:MAG: DUF488 family protein [Desulfomonile tiedjei]|uniref:DUF488 family protein n=1 Tax=Desulfomonile tiedjei TaxID=2358 RepID=A0A9D6V8Q4_9BACT|nr:DUF488 family protein [Desulfomonile tiedjei]
MLNRQRTLLYMLKKAGGSLTRIELMKWSFLLSQETSSGGGAAFYAFVPYKYGPYSFLLQQELFGLMKRGLLQEIGSKGWSLSALHEAAAESPRECQDIARIILRYKGMTINELIDTVYSRYPWYTVNSENFSRRAEVRPQADRAVYTIGYQGNSIDAFLNRVLKCGIKALADVRNNPSSRNFGFHKSTLARLCENLGIEYRGFPDLGIPASDRMDLKSLRDYEIVFGHYRSGVLANKTQSLDLLARLVTQKSTTLVCMESDANVCHRSILATLISERTNLPVIHLGIT